MSAGAKRDSTSTRTTLRSRAIAEILISSQPQCRVFGTGEAKGVIKESVRGYDLYLMVDVTNYSLTYSVCGYENHMSPDDHYADLKRIIAAVGGKARRITAIILFLYESRQHKRTARESLDCALALQGAYRYGRRQHHHL